MKRNIVFAIITTIAIQHLTAQILFEESSATANLNYAHTVDFGSGVSFCDFDNDGWDDLTVPGDENTTTSFFKNNFGVFEEVFFTVPVYLIPVPNTKYREKKIKNFPIFNGTGNQDTGGIF